MDSQQTEQILDLMGIMVSSYPSQAGQDSQNAARGYLMAVDECSFRAIRQVLENIIKGKQAGFDRKFAPTAGQLGEWCRNEDAMIARLEAPRRIPEHGIKTLNFGGRDIYTADMSLADVQKLIDTNGASFKGHDTIGGAARAAIDHVPGRQHWTAGNDAEDAA